MQKKDYSKLAVNLDKYTSDALSVAFGKMLEIWVGPFFFGKRYTGPYKQHLFELLNGKLRPKSTWYPAERLENCWLHLSGKNLHSSSMNAFGSKQIVQALYHPENCCGNCVTWLLLRALHDLWSSLVKASQDHDDHSRLVSHSCNQGRHLTLWEICHRLTDLSDAEIGYSRIWNLQLGSVSSCPFTIWYERVLARPTWLLTVPLYIQDGCQALHPTALRRHWILSPYGPHPGACVLNSLDFSEHVLLSIE